MRPSLLLRRLFLALLAASGTLSAHAVEQLIPGGSVLQCTVSEPKLSSKTSQIGDAVLCRLSHTEFYGRSVFPYGSYLEGRFEAYKDPGHFVGKGWMELKFDRLVVGNDTIVPISTRVIATPKNPVDNQGRIQGTGHTTRDIVEWSIPLLWPIDLLNLPRRGPTPVLKAETRLTVKVLDDFGIPSLDEVATSQPALVSRNQIAPAPIQQAAPQQQPSQPYYPPQGQSYAPPAYAPQPPSQTIIYQYPQPAPVIVQMPAPIAYSYPPPYYIPYAPPPRYRSFYPPY